MSTLGILIIVGVVLLVALVFGGLVWLFVRLSRPPQSQAIQPQTIQPGAPEPLPTVERTAGKQARRKRSKRPRR